MDFVGAATHFAASCQTSFLAAAITCSAFGRIQVNISGEAGGGASDGGASAETSDEGSGPGAGAGEGSASGAGSSVPAVHTTGSGEALVFHSGGVFEATWERENVQDMMRVVDAEGNDVILPPGRVWVNVFPDHRTLTWE